MQAEFRSVSNTLSPALASLYKAVSDKRGLHAAIGLGLASLGKRAFNDASLRPAPWASKANGQPSRLRDTGTLAKSIRLTTATNRGLTVGSDRDYAAIHQLGGKTAPHKIRPKNGKALFWPGAAHPVAFVNHPGSTMPARPYLPFDKSGRLTPQGVRLLEQVVRVRLRKP